MKRRFVFLMFIILLFSCSNKDEKLDSINDEKVFVTYELSPMASLMERMYVESLLLKEHVVKEGEEMAVSADFLEELQYATLTVPTDRDTFFEVQMQEFVDSYNLLSSQKVIKKDSYNAMIESCLSCHKVKCTGPIERIKKLIIK